MKSILKTGWTALTVLLLCGACDDSDGTVNYYGPDAGVTRLDVSPRVVEMTFSEEREFTVAVRPGNTQLTWESSDPSIAYVDENNKVVPVKSGVVDITCKAGDKTDEVHLIVHPEIDVPSFVVKEKGFSGEMPGISVLPEGTEYTITSSNEEAVKVTGHAITAAKNGISTLTVQSTATGYSKQFTMGVSDDEHTIAAKTASAYTYESTDLGKSYDVVALALATDGTTYADGGNWSGTGKGLFLKLFRESDADGLPAGIYSSGSAYAPLTFQTGGLSYVVDAATEAKDSIVSGTVTVENNAIHATLIMQSLVYIFDFSGTVPMSAHTYQSRVYGPSSFQITTNSSYRAQVYIDRNGSGSNIINGCPNGWRFTFYLDQQNSLGQCNVVLFSQDPDSPNGEYTVSDEKGKLGTVSNAGSSSNGYSYLKKVSWMSTDRINGGSLTVSDFEYDKAKKTVTVNLSGKFTLTSAPAADMMVPEINEQYSKMTFELQTGKQTYTIKDDR